MAVILDGDGDSYVVSDHSDLDTPGDMDWFHIFWCLPTNLAAGETNSLQQLWNHGTFGSGNFFHINCWEDTGSEPNTVSGGFASGGATSDWLGGDGDDGQKRLVCITYDAANDLLWCKNTVENGVSVNAASISSAGASSPSGAAAIGRRIQDHTREFHGWIGEWMRGTGLFINDANLFDAANGNGLNIAGATIHFYYEFEVSQATEPNIMGNVGDATREGDPITAPSHFPKLILPATGLVLPGPTLQGMGMGMG